MKGSGQLVLAILCAAGFIAWTWKLTHGMPLTFESGFFTAASLAAAIMFTAGAVKDFRE